MMELRQLSKEDILNLSRADKWIFIPWLPTAGRTCGQGLHGSNLFSPQIYPSWIIQQHKNRFCAQYLCQCNNYCNCCIRMFAFDLKTAGFDREELRCKDSNLSNPSIDHSLKNINLNIPLWSFRFTRTVRTGYLVAWSRTEVSHSC